jgi:hypothetical protein
MLRSKTQATPVGDLEEDGKLRLYARLYSR